jgi:hypothetical protein
VLAPRNAKSIAVIVACGFGSAAGLVAVTVNGVNPLPLFTAT